MSPSLDYLAKQATVALEGLQLKFARSAEAGAAIAGLEAIRALQTRVTELESTLFPVELTPDIKDVLSLMMWETGPIAHVFQSAGRDIARKGEAEQAFVMHWLIHLALTHGAGWRKAAREELTTLHEANKAAGK